MKTFLKFTGIISLILLAVTFILMMATPAIVGHTALGDWSVAGIDAIFGHKSTGLLDPNVNPSPLGLIAWILILVGILIVAVGVVLPLLKVNALEKFAGILNLIAVICFILAGVFMFIVIPTYYGANDANVPDGALLGAGWVIGAILAIAGGVVAILPALMDFLSKKK